MGRKVIDITDKLNFDENPVLIVKGHELEVDASAVSVIEIMSIIGDADEDSMTPDKVAAICERIFTKEAQETIKRLKLSFEDYNTLVLAAMDMIGGEEDEEGNM